MANFKVLTDNEILGVGQGGILTEAQLDGWAIDQLVRTGVLAEVSAPNPTKSKE